MKSDWWEYQEEAAAFFRTLGLNAETNVRLQGARTAHDIDVVVKFIYAGFNIVWLVECKYWKARVDKGHVLALRQIVVELGADRGILISETGFQSGAVEAANLTNVQLSSLADLRENTRHQISAMRLRELFDRIENCNERYWDISKDRRIQLGLRPEVGDVGYSGNQVIAYCRDILSQGMRGRSPIISDTPPPYSDTLPPYIYSDLKYQFSDAGEVALVAERLIAELEGKLASSSE